jgi:hypothetical protein
MNVSRNILRQTLGVALVVVLCVAAGPAQQTKATLRGVIKDELGATIVGATVTLTDPNGVERRPRPALKAPIFSADWCRESISCAPRRQVSQTLMRPRLM